MVKTGDRIVIEGSKVGGARREGTVVGTAGRMLQIRWPDGQESYLTPAPGTVKVVTGNSRRAAAPRSANPPLSRKQAPGARANKPKPAAKTAVRAAAKSGAKKRGAKKR
ncbi:MAG: DUF1918 domain-containing protein [Acidobacteria bacterium]|nr:DUF1918 domain-containing protein [Acidobacteriota bacterium]